MAHRIVLPSGLGVGLSSDIGMAVSPCLSLLDEVAVGGKLHYSGLARWISVPVCPVLNWSMDGGLLLNGGNRVGPGTPKGRNVGCCLSPCLSWVELRLEVGPVALAWSLLVSP